MGHNILLFFKGKTVFTIKPGLKIHLALQVTLSMPALNQALTVFSKGIRQYRLYCELNLSRHRKSAKRKFDKPYTINDLLIEDSVFFSQTY
ncbi:hypothetical protein J18TS1_07530 [Oceanobacillus oncorhynchi subsp. incaldanensis]|nr:hypothetical protein J18TS1_07530 [Oceanobacillus oncorhynchi subsp. incaldanensis]